MKQRHYTRHMHSHRLSLTVENSFGHGEILDWSTKGLRISSRIPLQMEGSQGVHLHALQDRGLMTPLELWDWTGEVRWSSNKENKWQAGIELDEPISDLQEKFEEIDFCYMFFTDRPSTTQKSVE